MAPSIDSLIVGPAVVTPHDVFDPGYVAIRDGRIVGVGPSGEHVTMPPETAAARLVKREGGWVVPGFVDVHVHGGGGAQVNGETREEVVESVSAIARFHARHGTTSLLATTVSDSPARLQTTVRGISDFIRVGVPDGARVLGAHLEGPFLARVRMGAQNPEALRMPDQTELRGLLALGGGTIRLVTIAPELPGAPDLIGVAVAADARVAVGHTDATYEQTVAAIEAGARHATHLFNAMPPLHHRRPGAVTALLLDERVTLELIADLEHVHPAVLELVSRLAPNRVVAVSDAVPATGLDSGDYRLGELGVTLAGSRVTLTANRETLAGSALSMDEAFRNLVDTVGLSIPEAVQATSATAASIMGMHDIGVIRAGALADLVLLDDHLNCCETMVGGITVHSADVKTEPSAKL